MSNAGGHANTAPAELLSNHGNSDRNIEPSALPSSPLGNTLPSINDSSAVNESELRAANDRCGLCGVRLSSFSLCEGRPHKCRMCNSVCCANCAPIGEGCMRYCLPCTGDQKGASFRLGTALEQYSTDAEVWAAVAAEMRDANSRVVFQGKSFSSAQCYARAIELAPGSRHWAALAKAIPQGGSVDITIDAKGTFRLSKMDCYANALYVSPNNTKIWCNMASDLAPTETVAINGERYNSISALLHAININPDDGVAWALLGAALHRLRKPSIFIGERNYTLLELFEVSLDKNPLRAATWNNLANILATEDSIRQAGREACRGHNGNSDADDHHGLEERTVTGNSSVLGMSFIEIAYRQPKPCVETFITHRGERYNRLRCAIEALKRHSSEGLIWFNLACAMRCNGHVTINNKQYSRKDVLHEVMHRPQSLYANVNLRFQMSVLVPNHHVLTEINRKYRYLEGKLLGKGGYGTVYEAEEYDYAVKEWKPTLAAKVIYNYGCKAHREALLNSNDEIRSLVDSRFSKRSVVACLHATANESGDCVVLYLERALGSLGTRVDGKLYFDPLRMLYSSQPATDFTASVTTQTNFARSPTSPGVPLNTMPFPYRLHESEIRFVACRVLSCLEELHQLGAAHQDIKPDNVLLFADGNVKLGDLGSIAQVAMNANKALQKGASTSVVGALARAPGGTLPYLAPEALIELRDPAYLTAALEKEAAHPQMILTSTVKRDVWSWAALVVHLGTGRLPLKTLPVNECRLSRALSWSTGTGFTALNFSDLGVPHIPATFSKELRCILVKCFAADPADRPSVHQLASLPYFTRSSLPADAESPALHGHRKQVAMTRANNGAGGIDPELSLLYRDISASLCPAVNSGVFSPTTPASQSMSISFAAVGGDSQLSNDLLNRFHVVLTGEVPTTC